jgi:hypothetical protein
MKINSINAYLNFFVLWFTVSCAGLTEIPDEILWIEMEKTPCYGACPVYTIRIARNGQGVFRGIENTRYTGTYSFRLHRKEKDALESAFRETGFFDLEDRYHAYVSDLPTTYLTLRSGGREKKITDYYGAPRELKDLEKKIEQLVFSKRLKPVRSPE